MLQRELGYLNQTMMEELSSANQTHLLEEVEKMLETIRNTSLVSANTVASRELRWVLDDSFFPLQVLI